MQRQKLTIVAGTWEERHRYKELEEMAEKTYVYPHDAKFIVRRIEQRCWRERRVYYKRNRNRGSPWNLLGLVKYPQDVYCFWRNQFGYVAAPFVGALKRGLEKYARICPREIRLLILKMYALQARKATVRRTSRKEMWLVAPKNGRSCCEEYVKHIWKLKPWARNSRYREILGNFPEHLRGKVPGETGGPSIKEDVNE